MQGCGLLRHTDFKLGWREDSDAELGRFKQAFMVKFSLELLNKVTNQWAINHNI